MKLTRIDLNSWIFDLAGQKILVDPWLVDPLVFYGSPWLFTAYHNTPLAFTPETLPLIDLILISQGLDDHCHKPTLAQLDRTIPVIAAPAAAKTLEELGYQKVQILAHWQEFQVGDRLTITAVPGAPIQPGQVENGYVLVDRTGSETLYYEPHLFPRDGGIGEKFGAIDLVIAPVVGQIFPFLGQVIMGPKEAIDLVETLKPRFYMPTTLGDIRASGILPALAKPVGNVEEFRDRLIASGLPTQLLVPAPGETLEVGKAGA